MATCFGPADHRPSQADQASSINQNKILRNAVQIFMYYGFPYYITALHCMYLKFSFCKMARRWSEIPKHVAITIRKTKN